MSTGSTSTHHNVGEKFESIQASREIGPLSAPSRRQFLRQALVVGGGGFLLDGGFGSIECLSARGQETAASARRDVSWLLEVQKPPQSLPSDAPALSPLLVDGEEREITTIDAWQRRRQQLTAAWQKYLGSLGERKGTPEITVLEHDTTTGVSRQLIRYEVEPGESTEAYLLRPTGAVKSRRAGVVVLHSTVDDSILQPAGLAMHDAAEKAFGLHLAQRGWVALCPLNFLWPTSDKINTRQAMEQFAKRHPGITGMAKMLHDAQVAVDLLAAQDDVDRDRLAAVGHSLGGKEVLYLAAFDPRIRCAVSSEGGVGMQFSNWDAPWYLGPGMKRDLAGHEHHELVSMAAPRAFLLIGGGTPNDRVAAKGADGDRSWPFIAEAMKVYRLFNERPKLGLYNHHKGHSVPTEAADRIYEWLAAYA